MAGFEEKYSHGKLLAVSWGMPPLLQPQAIQVPRMLKALSSFGWETTVLCANSQLMDTTLVHDQELAELFRKAYSSVVVKPPLPLRPLHSRLGYKVLRKIRLIDEVWQQWAMRTALRLMRTQHFHALATFALPWSDHLIGLELHRRTGIPWLAHFSDPWVDSQYVNKADRRYPAWCAQEEAIIRGADAVVFTTQHTVDLVMRKYPPEYREKVYVVPHGYDPAFLKIVPSSAKNTRLRMVSIGNFYRGRTPMPLLHALERLNSARPLGKELEVLLTGANTLPYAETAAGMGLGDVVAAQASVPFLESLRIAASGDILLVIDAPSDGASVFLPSKLIDYLMLEKPILGITPLAGSSAELLRRLDFPVAAPDDIPGIATAIAGLLDKNRLGTLGVSPAFAPVAREYEVTRTTRVLDCALRKICRS